ncbi:MAG: aminoacyl-tRNA hydrolase [Nitrospirae bacterium]|nr:aminoacyl-tRNA hydrolase [Nitrospirota bacterium]
MVILGLGNPGPRYAGTRHNVGYLVVERLAERWHVAVTDRKPTYAGGRGLVTGCDCYLAIGLTFMNLTGRAVSDLANKMGRQAANLVVVQDDIDLPPGKVRLKSGGGDGGHRGVRSIIATLGAKDFVRVKVGVGRPPDDRIDVADFVLQRFTPEEKPLVDQGVERAADAVEVLLRDGLLAAQTRIHGQG